MIRIDELGVETYRLAYFVPSSGELNLNAGSDPPPLA